MRTQSNIIPEEGESEEDEDRDDDFDDLQADEPKRVKIDSVIM